MVSKLRTMADKRARPGTAMSVRASGQGDRRIVKVSGELDMASRDDLFDACAAGTHAVTIIDLGALSFMDCGGYSGLLRIRNAAEWRGRSVAIRNAAGQPERLLALIAELSH